MTGLPKVSIITTTYKSQLYVEKAIQSVLNQTYPNIEYLIIDGASQDRTLAIISKYQNKIATVISEPDHGIYDAFNKGVRIATGDIVYFLNSDDYLVDQNVIAEVAAVFAENPDLSMVYGNMIVLDEALQHSFIQGRLYTIDDLKKGAMPPHPAFFARKELYAEHGGFDLKYRSAGDLDFIIKCFKTNINRARYVDRNIAVFRLGGLCSNYKTQRIGMDETRQIIKEHFQVDLPTSNNDSENILLYKMWLESLLIHDKPITAILKEQSVNKVAVFGTMRTALYLWADLSRSNIGVACFLDNNPKMHGQKIRDIEVQPPNWLVDHVGVDAVLISVEADHDAQIRDQLVGLLKEKPKPILSWKELVVMNQKR